MSCQRNEKVANKAIARRLKKERRERPTTVSVVVVEQQPGNIRSIRGGSPVRVSV